MVIILSTESSELLLNNQVPLFPINTSFMNSQKLIPFEVPKFKNRLPDTLWQIGIAIFFTVTLNCVHFILDIVLDFFHPELELLHEPWLDIAYIYIIFSMK